jgi:Na+-translocating ferredoxin:NAD+ oxidoreductase RnfC subunit
MAIAAADGSRSVTISPRTIQANGVVGAGGAGFPTHVKMQARAEFFLLNAAECEPLLHKDKELLAHYPDRILDGMRAAAAMVGAAQCVIGIKEKYTRVIETLEKQLPAGFRIQRLRDTYPAGDEFVLVYDVTGRVIPPGGLPIHVGCVVNNVETMLNVAANRPVTHKYLTVAGAVKHPTTFCVPIGMSIGEIIQAAGGPLIPNPWILLNGIMMGRPAAGLDESVTKTTGGIYVLPGDHPLVARHLRKEAAITRIGRSACDQCSFCTELCPRYLLGHPIEPHKAMRALGFTQGKAALIVGTLYCCECNICTMIACPEDLDPRSVCVFDKQVVRQQGLKWERGGREIVAHPMFEHRRTPVKRLMQKLALNGFVNTGPLREASLETDRVRIAVKQHAGAAAVPVVSIGQKVREGDVLAIPPEGQLGAVVHASLGGSVTAVGEYVEIRR